MSDKAPDRGAPVRAPSGRSRVPLYLVALFLVAVVLRVVAAEWVAGGLGRGLDGDEPDYFARAVSLVEGRGVAGADGRPSSARTPGVPLVLAALFFFTGPSVVWGRVLMCTLGALLVPVCYLLGRELADRRAGMICALAAAVFPNWVRYGGDLLTDLSSATATGLLAWALVEGWRKNSLRWYGLAGLFAGAGALLRPTGLALLPGVVLWIFLVAPGWRRRMEAGALVCLVFAAALAPWASRNTALQGEFVPASTGGGIELYIGNNPRATGILSHDFHLFSDELSLIHPRELHPNEARRSRLYQSDAMAFIRENPGRFLELCAVRLGQFWKVYSPRVPLWQSLLTIMSFGVALPLAALHVARRGWRRDATLLFVILIASQTAVHAVFTSVIRYRIPIEPLVLALAAAGLVWLLDRRQPPKRGLTTLV